MRARALITAGCVASIGLLAGCSHSVDHKQLSGKVKTALEKSVGQKAKSVTCPDDLKGKVDATTRCTLVTMDNTTFGVTVTVTSVKGNDIKYTANVDKTPQ